MCNYVNNSWWSQIITDVESTALVRKKSRLPGWNRRWRLLDSELKWWMYCRCLTDGFVMIYSGIKQFIQDSTNSKYILPNLWSLGHHMHVWWLYNWWCGLLMLHTFTYQLFPLPRMFFSFQDSGQDMFANVDVLSEMRCMHNVHTDVETTIWVFP